MIARVRIAPLEQWKEKHPKCVGLLEPGRPVEIETDSLWWTTADDTGERLRNWHLVGESLRWLQSLPSPSGGSPANSLCECLLEMD